MSMSSLSHLIRSLTAEPLVIERRALDSFRMMLARGVLDGIAITGEALHAAVGIAAPRKGRTKSADRNVAIIPLVGAVANRAHSFGMGALDFSRAVRSAAADRRIDAIAIDIESPGGTVTGVPEAAAAVFEARKTKPVVAVSNGLMASAAYWIGSAASEVVSSPSSETGSIGVIAIHEDWSKWLENEGIAVTEISEGQFKTEGAPWKPLDGEAEDFFRARAREVYDWFIRDVARFRGDNQANVRSGYGRGRVLDAKAAISAGLVDRVATLDEVISELAAGYTPRRTSRGMSAAVPDDIEPIAAAREALRNDMREAAARFNEAMLEAVNDLGEDLEVGADAAELEESDDELTIPGRVEASAEPEPESDEPVESPESEPAFASRHTVDLEVERRKRARRRGVA